MGLKITKNAKVIKLSANHEDERIRCINEEVVDIDEAKKQNEEFVEDENNKTIISF